MKVNSLILPFKLDKDGHLVKTRNEPDDQLLVRHAETLWAQKMTRNTTQQVIKSITDVKGSLP